MPTRNSVAAYLRQGLVIEPHEAVAIVQELIAAGVPLRELEAPFGPPTADSVELSSDGHVVCRHCGVTPAVSELGQLLESMLSAAGTLRAPGGLRYTIARALNDVDAPPFDSLGAFAAALARYEQSDRGAVLRGLAARAILEPLLSEPLPERPLSTGAPVSEPIVPASLPAMGDVANVAYVTEPSVDELFINAPLVHNLIVDDPLIHEPPSTRDRLSVVSFEPHSLPSERRRAPWLAIAALAASVCFSATYVLVSHARLQQNAAPEAMPAADAPPPTPFSATPDSAPPSREQRAVTTDAPAPSRDRAVRTSGTDAPQRIDGAIFSPTFDANGTALFFHTGRSSDARSALAESRLDDLEVMTILDDGAKNYHVQPSPDGTRIAFDSDRDGERGVYVADRNGSNVHRVSGPGYAAVPSWSPDSTQLAFNRAEPDRPNVWNLWLTTLATSQSRRLTNFRVGQTWGASWFASGNAVAYTHEDELTVLNLENASTRVFKTPVAGRLVRTAAVSPDGRHIIFQVAHSGAWLVDLSDGSMRCALTDPTAEEFAWSPDGRRVAFHSRRDGQWGVWVMAPRA